MWGFQFRKSPAVAIERMAAGKSFSETETSRYWQIAFQAQRLSFESSLRRYKKKIRNILGMEKTRCRCGQSASTFERTNSPHKTDRLAEHDGQNPLRLQENASRYSSLQVGQRMRANPFFRIPQSRYFPTTRAMTGRHLP